MRRSMPQAARDIVPNLAPMVDVIMVILIFFILGATLKLIKEGALRTELDPRSGPSSGAAVEIIPAVKIALEATGTTSPGCQIYLMGEPLAGNTFELLRAKLEERRKAGADTANPVVIASQGPVRWRYVVSAMDAAVLSGFKNVQFTVSLSTPDPGKK